MKLNPSVSVIIPTYNREKTIVSAVRSACNQTYEPFEIIIIDDGSTDNTAQKIKSINDSRIIYHKLEKNAGVSNARNVGALIAKGEWIAFQDSDDIWRDIKLERQIEYIGEHSQIQLVYSEYLMHRLNGQEVSVPNEGFYGKWEGNIFETVLVNNIVGTPTIMVKRETFQSVGGFRTELNCLEDWDFVLRFAKEHSIGCVKEILVDAYQTEGSISSQPAAYYQVRCQMIADYREELMKRNLFDIVVKNLFESAQRANVLTSVQRMLTLMLSVKK